MLLRSTVLFFATALLATIPSVSTRAQGEALSSTEEQIKKLHEAIERDEARKAQIDAEIAGLGKRRRKAQERLELRTRGLYRMSQSGYFPLAGGVDAMLGHLSRVDRVKRLVKAELDGLQELRAHGYALKDETGQLAKKIQSNKATLKGLVAQRSTIKEEVRMASMFDEAFKSHAKPAPGTITHTPYGTIRVHEQPAPVERDFGALRGQLTLPLAGAQSVKAARREDGDGVEFVSAPGAVIRASGEGTIAFAGRRAGYGQLVIIDHGNRYFTVYSGFSDLSVRVGDMVSRGARLGHVGSGTLYFEIRRGTKSLDARSWLGV